MPRPFLALIAASLSCAALANPHQEAARELDQTIAERYAYLDDLPGAQVPKSEELEIQRDAVRDGRSLLRYAETRLATLADHHAITGSSFSDSWAVIPTYADLWVVREGARFAVDAVREGSPAEEAGVAAGNTITHVNGEPIDKAVAAFWAEMGLEVTVARAGYAARVLLAGRRDRLRVFTIVDAAGQERQLTLPSLYDVPSPPLDPLRVCVGEEQAVIRFNNGLGDSATIAAFDEALAATPETHQLVLDLRDTPSGGNTMIARAIMGWFVEKARSYQTHLSPVEERMTGVARQWVEQVLPREGKYRSQMPVLRVGRWTGSMGEGLAIGFDALGADVFGTRMAGLKGAIEDIRIGDTDLVVKLPTERLLSVSGLPREDFVPEPIPLERFESPKC
ncbi:MAG: PDZ domain-containing protein [Pseudomonadota bacterium]